LNLAGLFCSKLEGHRWPQHIEMAIKEQQAMRFVKRVPQRLPQQFAIAAILAVGCVATLGSQEPAKQVLVDEKTLQSLLQRVDQLEARVKELEKEKAPSASMNPAGDSASAAPSATAPARPAVTVVSTATANSAPKQTAMSSSVETEQAQSDNAMERMDVSRTLLRIRGFGDISLHGDTQKGDTTSFSLGQLDLFVTSDVSDKFRFLSEIVFENGGTDIYGTQVGDKNSFGVDIERYLMQYSHNDYLNISAGRGHTAIGYYNTEYHHSSWLQTATGRPFLFDFEDHGGILPIHTVGVTASGQIPSGSLGLHYVAEVGNGRASRTPLTAEPVQNDVDDQNHKAYNFELFARPEAVRGLQTGFSFYRDVLSPANSPRVGESIFAAHAVLIRPRYEWLNEAVLDRHTIQGTQFDYNTPAFYTQLSRQFGSYRPYLRYQYMNVAKTEPIFPDVGLRQGPSLGLRFDASESVALKLQYDYTKLRDQPAINALELQLGFTF
jgi:cell division protein FtsB